MDIKNAILASAVCDAVGNPFEFKRNIRPESVTKYTNSATKLIISDDTQMNLFGMEAVSRLNNRTIDSNMILSEFTKSYIDWYYTQIYNPETYKSYNNKSGLLSFKSMYSIQAPGYTCLDSLRILCNGGIVKNQSLGCGSVMRLIPLVYMLNKNSLEDVISYAKITGSITHKHIGNDSAIQRYINTAYDISNGIQLENINAGVSSANELGEGWIAPECVDIGIWAYCTASSFDDLLIRSICHDGDSDSTAAIAGSLWGLSGNEIPTKYIQKLDALDAITHITNQL